MTQQTKCKECGGKGRLENGDDKFVNGISTTVNCGSCDGTGEPKEKEIEICECGFPQSYPIPHKHSMKYKHLVTDIANANTREQQSSDFSNFIRNGSPEEKEEVFMRVMEKATQDQKDIMEQQPECKCKQCGRELEVEVDYCRERCLIEANQKEYERN